MMIDKLREATSRIHQELDSWLMPIFKNTNTLDRYELLLKAFYGFYSPVMDKIVGEIDGQYLPDFAQRRSPDLILDDIDGIERSSGTIDLATQTPEINNASQAFGALYVLEGSTLGGVYLSKMLAENMSINKNTGLSFFYGYGKQTKERWNVFLDELNRFGSEKADEQLVLSAGIETFELLKQHLQKTLCYS